MQRSQPLRNECPGPESLLLVADPGQRLGADLGGDALLSEFMRQSPTRQPLTVVPTGHQELRVRCVVDQADLGHPIEHLTSYVLRATALAQLRLELGPRARTISKLPKHHPPRHVVRVRFGVRSRVGVMVRWRRPTMGAACSHSITGWLVPSHNGLIHHVDSELDREFGH